MDDQLIDEDLNQLLGEQPHDKVIPIQDQICRLRRDAFCQFFIQHAVYSPFWTRFSAR